MDPYAHRVTYAPFNAIPSLKNIYLSAAHQSALISILESIKPQNGCIVITGEQGIGKTTLIRACLQRLEQLTPPIHCCFETGNPTLSCQDVSRRVAETLVNAARENPAIHLLQIRRRELERSPRRQHVVFVIDDAHKLASETLGKIIECIESTKDGPNPAQLILLGLPSLNEKLSKRLSPILDERIALQVGLAPLTPQESQAYIHQQLSQSLQSDTELFTEAALRLIIRCAKGIPQHLSILCADALNLTTYGHTKPLSVETLKRELLNVEPSRVFSSRRLSLIGMLGLGFAALVFSIYFYGWQPLAAQYETQAKVIKKALPASMLPIETKSQTPVSIPSRPLNKFTSAAPAPPLPFAQLVNPRLPSDIPTQKMMRLKGQDFIQKQVPYESSAPATPPLFSESGVSQDKVSTVKTTVPAETSISVEEQRINHLLHEAERLRQANKLSLPEGASARDRYQAVLKIDPDNAAAKKGLALIIEQYEQWGRQAKEKKQYAKASAYYQRLLAITKPDAALYYALGSVYHKAGQHPQALRAYTRALQLEPAQPLARRALATLQTEQMITVLHTNNFNHIQAKVDENRQLTLSGYVNNDNEEARILILARFQPGIKQVINDLQNRTQIIIQGIHQGSFISEKYIKDSS